MVVVTLLSSDVPILCAVPLEYLFLDDPHLADPSHDPLVQNHGGIFFSTTGTISV